MPDAPDTPAPTRTAPTAVVTVPNAITVARIMGTGVLPVLAHAGLATPFVWLLVVLLVTDWLDGKLAILLGQRTVLGARLDSAADVILYATLVPSAWWLRPEFVRSDAVLLAVTGASYLLAVGACVVRFRRLPAYHTRAAKTCWLLIGVGTVFLFSGGSVWPTRVALAAVILTNLEAAAISCLLPRWRTDVTSVFHALGDRRADCGRPGPSPC